MIAIANYLFSFAFIGTRTSSHGFIIKAIRKSSWIDFVKTAFASGLGTTTQEQVTR